MLRNIIVIVTLVLVAILPFVTREHRAQVPSGVKIIRNLSYMPAEAEKDPLRELDLFLPRLKYGKSMPVIVWIHGGGWIEGDKNDSPALELARQGFATASINYRLAPEATFPAQIRDCKRAIAWIRKHGPEYGIDPDRIGVWGLSSGGHLAALLATTSGTKLFEEDLPASEKGSTAISACCDWSGPTDLINFREQCPPDAVYSTFQPADLVDRLLGGPVQENEALAREASPITYASENCPPILIMHAAEDPIVPFIQSQEFANKLKGLGAPVKMIKVNSDDHVIFNSGTFETVTDFFAEELKSKSPAANQSQNQI